ncbi:MAG: formyltransferase family protein [Candidatus Peregrinibacteria bacterium]
MHPTPEHIPGMHFYGHPSLAVPASSPRSPVGVLFLTSVRDIGADDHVGQIVATDEGPRRMEGIVERTVNETRSGGALEGILRVAGVVTDDLSRDLRHSSYPVIPEPGRDWIHPLDLETTEGQLVVDPRFTINVPSDFRALPRADRDGRAQRKEAFERRVMDIADERGADVIVSDHYMAWIQYMINDQYGRYGRVLNIHPAVTIPGHPFCFTGKTPTGDAIRHAQTGQPTFTGATLHFVDPEIDHGPPIAVASATPVHADDEPERLRYRNYQQSKLPLFIAGMRHYVERILPQLDALDVNSLSLLTHDASIRAA